MYLSKIEIDLSSSNARKCIANAQILHRSLMKYFGTSRAESNVLYRLRNDKRGKCVVYMMSDKAPSGDDPFGLKLIGYNNIDKYIHSFDNGMILAFDILAVPTKKVAFEEVPNSRRVFLKTKQERLDWFNKKADQSGIKVLSVDENGQSKVYASKDDIKMYITTVRFTGVLKIINKDAFIKAFRQGIGPEKAYGNGMLMVKSV